MPLSTSDCLIPNEGSWVGSSGLQSLEVHVEVGEGKSMTIWPPSCCLYDVVTCGGDLIPREGFVVENVARGSRGFDLLEGEPSVCLEEAVGVFYSGVGHLACILDTFGGEVPQFDIVHSLDLVSGKLRGEVRDAWGNVGILEFGEYNLLSHWLRVVGPLFWSTWRGSRRDRGHRGSGSSLDTPVVP
jgi:hypothetical protein